MKSICLNTYFQVLATTGNTSRADGVTRIARISSFKRSLPEYKIPLKSKRNQQSVEQSPSENSARTLVTTSQRSKRPETHENSVEILNAKMRRADNSTVSEPAFQRRASPNLSTNSSAKPSVFKRRNLQEDPTVRKRSKPARVAAPKQRSTRPVAPQKSHPAVKPTTKAASSQSAVISNDNKPTPIKATPVQQQKKSPMASSKISEKAHCQSKLEASHEVDFPKTDPALVFHLLVIGLAIMKTREYNTPLFMACVKFKPRFEQELDNEYINGLLSVKPQIVHLYSNGCLDGFLCYNNSAILLASSKDELQKNLQEFAEETAAKKLEIDIENTKIMARKEIQIHLNEKRLAQVDSFDHFGQHISIFGSYKVEISNRVNSAGAIFRRFKEVLEHRTFPINKINCYENKVLPALLYGCETWALTQVEKNKLERAHNKFVKKMTGECPSKNKSAASKFKSPLVEATRRKCRYARMIANNKNSVQKAAHDLDKWRCHQRKRGRPCIRWDDDLVKDWDERAKKNCRWELIAEKNFFNPLEFLQST
ncbi:hypothetical protein L596_017335 [Steinernema carpocapsae]|uniref:Reverse transcriptase domain-containing protein n=1 Tax=Steinernema carpocapsae TaxID=34508 RepID=A0A4U5N1C0_STECR|nr:hypothetical protein L596_017335 [Steinernema carpocapsae]